MKTHVEVGQLGPSSTWGKLGLLSSLYFSQGLPFGFFTQALPVLLRKEGLSLGQIGLSSLLAVPWALKFLWAPAVDRLALRGAGKRKSWIVPLQLGAVVVLTALASGTSLAEHPVALLMTAVFLLNLLAATQDIATDGLAVDMLAPKERGLANGIQVAGYRVGMIVGGGVLLIFHEQLGSSWTFLAMAALTALATLPIALTREPTTGAHEQEDNGRTVQSVHFLRRPYAFRILSLLVAYKVGDAFATGMLRPFLADSGLTLSDIGWLLGTVGFVSGMLGALAGGALVNVLGRKQALLSFGVLQAASVAGYAYLASSQPGPLALYFVCAAEHVASGMATATLFTCMMDWSGPETSATDYTVQASAVVIASGAAGAVSGFSAEAFGYLGHFVLGTALALGGLVIVWRYFPARVGPLAPATAGEAGASAGLTAGSSRERDRSGSA